MLTKFFRKFCIPTAILPKVGEYTTLEPLSSQASDKVVTKVVIQDEPIGSETQTQKLIDIESFYYRLRYVGDNKNCDFHYGGCGSDSTDSLCTCPEIHPFDRQQIAIFSTEFWNNMLTRPSKQWDDVYATAIKSHYDSVLSRNV